MATPLSQPRPPCSHIRRQRAGGIKHADSVCYRKMHRGRSMRRKPYNVEFFYRGCLRKSEEWPVVLGALALIGAQIGFALFLLFR